MPRRARKRSKTGIYHVMLRGIDNEDYFIPNEFATKTLKKVDKGTFLLFSKII